MTLHDLPHFWSADAHTLVAHCGWSNCTSADIRSVREWAHRQGFRPTPTYKYESVKRAFKLQMFPYSITGIHRTTLPQTPENPGGHRHGLDIVMVESCLWIDKHSIPLGQFGIDWKKFIKLWNTPQKLESMIPVTIERV